MSATEILQELRAAGVLLWVEGEKLRCKGPEEVLTAEVVSLLSKKKHEIMNFLTCHDCNHRETLPKWVDGCVYTTGDQYQEIWTVLDALDGCPREYWN